ncbi:MAG TPA: HEAT repeat domain-containing protein [Acidimicrobiales bacterium]
MTVEGAPERRRAVALAGHRGDRELARAGLTDPDASVRETALGALERLGALEDADVRTALQDSDAGVRRRAAEAAAARPSVELRGALSDADSSVVEMAAWSCGERERAGTAVLRALVALATGHRDALVREAAVAALGAIGDPSGLSAILAATYDKPAVRRRAVIALTPFDGPDVDEALERALSDRDWQVRQIAEDIRDA